MKPRQDTTVSRPPVKSATPTSTASSSLSAASLLSLVRRQLMRSSPGLERRSGYMVASGLDPTGGEKDGDKVGKREHEEDQ